MFAITSWEYKCYIHPNDNTQVYLIINDLIYLDGINTTIPTNRA